MPRHLTFPATPGPAARRHFADDCLPRLELEPAMAGSGLFDGAWWPRSRGVAAELPDLITALGAHLGRIRRVTLDRQAWEDAPRSITVNKDPVRISWLAAGTGTGTIGLSLGIQSRILLLVVPPGTARRTAAAAMLCAAAAGNHTPAGELLGRDGGGDGGCDGGTSGNGSGTAPD